jgi:outer membrane protein TolC
MSGDRSGVIVLPALAVCLLLGMASPVQAQPQPAGPQAGSPPPVVRFAPDGVVLTEAVTIAIKNDPALKLANIDVRRREGAAQQQSGAFDLTLLANVDFSYRVQELSTTRFNDEVKKRTNLQEFIDSNSEGVVDSGQLVVLLKQLQVLPPGDPKVASLFQFSPTLAAQIQSLDAMILSPSTPADVKAQITTTRTQLINDLANDTQAQVTEDAQTLADAKERLNRMGEAPHDEYFRNGGFGLNLTKYFRNGISVTPFFDGKIESTSYKGKPISEIDGGKGVQDQLSSRLGVSFVLPLMRGRGSDVVASGERAALLEVDAGRLQSEHQAAASALGVVRAYWSLRGAQEALQVSQRSLELQSQILDSTKKLVEAGEVVRAELARSQASEARARASVSEGERRVHEARVALAVAMGIGATDDDATLPRAKDAFPEIAEPAAGAGGGIEEIARAAVDKRADLLAARKLEAAGLVLEKGARLGTKSRLDLNADTYYTALGERSLGRVVDRWVGPSVDLGLEYEKPLGNNALRGTLVQREAERVQRQISSADLERQIRLGVIRTGMSLQDAMERARQAAESVRYYQQSITAEFDRFKIGESTLLNTLVTEGQLTEAKLNAIAALQQVATLVAELRYESGTLLSGGAVAGPNLVTVPRIGGR